MRCSLSASAWVGRASGPDRDTSSGTRRVSSPRPPRAVASSWSPSWEVMWRMISTNGRYEPRLSWLQRPHETVIDGSRSLTSSETILVLPMPDSPTTSTRRQPLASELRSRSNSSWRPTKVVRQRRFVAAGRPTRTRDSSRRSAAARPRSSSVTAVNGSPASADGVVENVRARPAISSGLKSRARASCRKVDIRGVRFRPRSSAAMAVGLKRARSASASWVRPCAIR